MIDIEKEELIPLRDVPKALPKRPSGKRIHISAIYRWVQRGVRGIRLESTRIGGTTYTSKQALQRFSEASTDPAQPQPRMTYKTPKRRQREIERASREAERLLYPKGRVNRRGP